MGIRIGKTLTINPISIMTRFHIHSAYNLFGDFIQL
ncbi:hypothetical protein E2C01_094533 [Portunus trituberculatus]|uniref:Uncharacterized protein n=1 Tax=Portunus trituberculatus TaxID=210409 RepID=A0A5B7K0Y6_PORTR|nr:hypothetical protein [Portunus trituberculatus]